MDSIAPFILLIVLACSVDALEHTDEDQSLRQSLLGSIFRNYYNSFGSEDKHLRSLPLDYSDTFAVKVAPLRERFLEEKEKKSPLYRLTKPISSRQTRLAAFGTMLLPKERENSAQKVWRYG